jgi:hypothetical protein
LTFDTVDPEPNPALTSEESKLEAVDGMTDHTPQFLTSEDFFCVDQHKMGQVVRNLISNAIKFTPGGKPVVIKIRKLPPQTHTSEHLESPRVLQHANYDLLPGRSGGRLRAYTNSTPEVRSRTASGSVKADGDASTSTVTAPADVENGNGNGNGQFLLFANISADSDLDKQKAKENDHGCLVLEVREFMR